MKSLKELNAIKEKMQAGNNMRKETSDNDIRIVVGMATCGIAAGARPVLNAFVDEVSKRALKNIVVMQTGCIGMCKLEPLVDVILPGQPKVTYVKVTPDMVARIVADHVVNGNVVNEFTIK